jgi:hypothetical protein
MHLSTKRYFQSLTASGLIALSIPSSAQAQTPPVPDANGDYIGGTYLPIRADRLSEMAGVNVRIDGDPFYPANSAWTTVRPWIGELGVRTVRQTIGWKGFWANYKYKVSETAPTITYAGPTSFGNNASAKQPYFDSTFQRSRTIDLYATFGISTNMNIGGIYEWGNLVNSDTIDKDLIKAQLLTLRYNYGSAISAIEGQNEYKNGREDITGGKSAKWARVRQYANDLAQLRNDVGLGAKFLVMPSLWNSSVSYVPTDANRLKDVYSVVNFGNTHHYSGANSPGTYLKTDVDAVRQFCVNSGGTTPNYRPVSITEFGTHTKEHTIEQGGKSSPIIQAANLPRYLCEMARLGTVGKAFVYNLINDPQREAGQHDWGMIDVTMNGTPPTHTFSGYKRMAGYYSLQSFLGLMKEANWTGTQWDLPTFTPQALPIDILGTESNIKFLLTQKATKEYLLLLWRDNPVVDAATGVSSVEATEHAITVIIRRAQTNTATTPTLKHVRPSDISLQEPTGSGTTLKTPWKMSPVSFASGKTGTTGSTFGAPYTNLKYPYIFFGVKNYVTAISITYPNP